MKKKKALEILNDLVAVASGANLDADFYEEIEQMEDYIIENIE